MVIHYSGHGSHVTDVHGNEPSGMDSTTVPHDSGRGVHPIRDILDDEIQEWLARLSQKTHYLTSLSTTAIRTTALGQATWAEVEDSGLLAMPTHAASEADAPPP